MHDVALLILGVALGSIPPLALAARELRRASQSLRLVREMWREGRRGR